MKNIQNLIAYICDLAIKHASAGGLDYAEDFIDPKNWEMKEFVQNGKKYSILWNEYFSINWSFYNISDKILYDPEKSKNILETQEESRQDYYYYKRFAGNTEEEAMEKWVDYLFDGTESLSSVRMHLAITGNTL